MLLFSWNKSFSKMGRYLLSCEKLSSDSIILRNKEGWAVMVTKEQRPCCISKHSMDLKICEFVMSDSTCTGVSFCVFYIAMIWSLNMLTKTVIGEFFRNILNYWDVFGLVIATLLNLPTHWKYSVTNQVKFKLCHSFEGAYWGL